MGSIPTRSRHLSTAPRPALTTFVILNPAAGHGRGARVRDEVVEAARAHWGHVELMPTEAPGHALEMVRTLPAEVERLVAVGGDGTVHEVANGLLQGRSEAPPPLGVVPVGTGNDFAKMTGTVRGGPADVIASLATGQVRRFDVGVAWGECFVNSLGVGLDADVARRVNEYKHWPGSLGYVVAAIQGLVHRRAHRLHIAVDGLAWTEATTVLEIGNGPCAGGVFYLTPDAVPDDGLLDVCAIGEFGPLFLLTKAVRVLRGHHTTLREVRMARGSRVRVTSEDGPLLAHLDGELRNPGFDTLEVSVRAAALPVLVGARGGNG